MLQQHSFESAYKRLQEIHTILTTKDLVDIDGLLSLQQEAKELYEFLQKRLSILVSKV